MPLFVFFDFDGVITDTFSDCLEITRTKNAQMTAEDYRAWYEGNIYDAVRRADTQAVPREEFFVRYEPRLQKCALFPGIAQAIRTIANTHSLAIVSSTPRKMIAEYLERANLLYHFKDILGLEAHASKVKKFRTLLQKYEVAPNECVYVTDTSGDVKEAAEVEIPSIGVTWGYHPRETLARADAAKIVDSPKELTEYLISNFSA